MYDQFVELGILGECIYIIIHACKVAGHIIVVSQCPPHPPKLGNRVKIKNTKLKSHHEMFYQHMYIYMYNVMYT